MRTSKKGMSSSVENFMALTVVVNVQNIDHILRHIVSTGKISKNLGICLKFKQIGRFSGLVGVLVHETLF